MEDLVGKIFGKWKVIEKSSKKRMWYCECECGTKRNVIDSCLKSGESLSCGCYHREKMSLIFKKYNTYNLSGKFGIGYTFKNEEFYFDLEDYDLIKEYCWSYNDSGYLVSRELNEYKKIRMHILIMKNYYNTNKRIDHINRIRHDNRKENLRFVTNQQNNINSNISIRNTSGTIGLSWSKEKRKWEVYIGKDYETIKIGYFTNKQDAIIARLKAELEYFGLDFAPQRHLFEEYGII